MKNLVLIAALTVLLLFSVATAVDVIREDDTTSYSTPNTVNFKTKTIAVCEDRADSVYCHDELLVNCENDVYLLPKTEKTVKCGNVELQVPSITAFAVFDKDWKDPRIVTG